MDLILLRELRYSISLTDRLKYDARFLIASVLLSLCYRTPFFVRKINLVRYQNNEGGGDFSYRQLADQLLTF